MSWWHPIIVLLCWAVGFEMGRGPRTHVHCALCGYPVFPPRSMLEHYETDCRMPGHARDRAAELRLRRVVEEQRP